MTPSTREAKRAAPGVRRNLDSARTALKARAEGREEKRRRVAEIVNRHLADLSFASKLAANDAGERPIVIALPSDRLLRVIRQAEQVGGVANLFVLLEQGLVGIALKRASSNTVRANREAIKKLPMDCTVGQFVARIELGSSAIFKFEDHRELAVPREVPSARSARVVALADAA